MRRKLILIFLSLAIFSSVFTVFALALDGEITDADEAIEVEKKKLSEFTDEELVEHLSDKKLSLRETDYYGYDGFWAVTRDQIRTLEQFLDQLDTLEGAPCIYNDVAWMIHMRDLRIIVAEYYGIESNCADADYDDLLVKLREREELKK